MNVAPARNCVSTSHFAAATCHYCTITVCTTIVASRTSLASLTITLEIVLDFCTKKKEEKEEETRARFHRLLRELIEKSIACGWISRARCAKELFLLDNFLFSRSIRDLARSVSFPFSFPVRALICESCAHTNTIHLNPIILADYWLDSVCSLCRWSRLTLSLPCLVRLHIYIINYITLLIIIFTPSRSHA